MKNIYNHLTIKALLLATAGMCASLPVAAQNGNGMTWAYRGMSFPAPNNSALQRKSVFVGCHGASGVSCNPYQGETSCSVKRHLLCVKDTGNIKRPPYAVTTVNHAMPKEYYAGWSPKKIKLGPKKRGSDLTSLAVANQFCGVGWKMAEFHDGFWKSGMSTAQHFGNSWNINSTRRGGWGFHARFQGNANRLQKLKTKRFWVNINDQQGNCWN